jgi:hypothetical protein
MTAVTVSTLLQKLVRPGNPTEPPTFEQIAVVVRRLAERFMVESRRFGSNGLFKAALFGWCPRATKYKIAHIDGRDDSGFRVELSYPVPPQTDGDPWLVLGGGAPAFESALAEYRRAENHITKRVPRRVIEKMVAEGSDRTVGGATSIGYTDQFGFELCYALESITHGQPAARRIFNGLDLDAEIGQIGQYLVGASGLA